MLTKVPINQFAKVGSGQGAPQRETDFSETGIPFIRAGSLEDLLKGMEEYALPKVSEEIAREYKLKLFQPNTIVFAKSGMSALKGRIYKLKNPCYVVNHLATLELLDNAVADYVLYTLRHFSPVKLINDNAYPSLKQSVIENYEVPFPKNKEDQLHIANILSKAENLIAQRKESIRLLDEFLKSTFLEMFGEPEKNPKNLPFTELEKLCSIIVDCPHSTPVKSKEVTNYPCIRTSELTNGYISWDSMQYLEEDEYIKRTQRLIPEAGDIVYGREGTYGEAIRIPETHRFSLGQRTMLFRPDYTKTNSIFLWAMVRSEFVYRQAKKKNSGSTVGHVNVKDIKQFRIYNPPIELQNQFAQIVEKTEALKSQYQQSLGELENLYGSLSQTAFKGELGV